VRNVPVALTWIGVGKVTTDKVEFGPRTSVFLVWSRSAVVTGTVDGLSVTATKEATLTKRWTVFNTQ